MAFSSFSNPSANTSNTNPNPGGLFGLTQNTNTTQNTTPPSLFGNTNPAPNPLQPQPTQQSLFGNTNTNAGGTNTSTTQNTNTNTNTGGGLFGQQQQQQQQPSTGGGIFGNTNNSTSTNNIFGNVPPAQAQVGLNNPSFGGLNPAPVAGSTSTLNPNPLTSTTGVGTGITGQQQQLEAQEQFIKITQGVEAVYHAWHPASNQCRFQVRFFLVSPFPWP